MVDLDDLLDSAGVAEVLGISGARSVSTYRSRDPEFPEPVLVSMGGRCQYWVRQDVEAWQEAKRRRRRS
jgi:predicted DNA-binding transcriptional regulator AlpA